MSKTRLNASLRQQIIDNVIAATEIPQRRKEIHEQARAAAKAYLEALTPPEFKALAAGKPKAWFRQQMTVPVHSGSALYAEFVSVALHDPFTLPVNAYVSLRDAEPFFQEAELAAAKLREEEQSLRGELHQALISCNTVEAFVARMPELAPYCPKSAPAGGALVAPSNVLSALVAAGFKPEG